MSRQKSLCRIAPFSHAASEQFLAQRPAEFLAQRPAQFRAQHVAPFCRHPAPL
jgi:hypothetical protein